MLLNSICSWKRICQRSWLNLLPKFHNFFSIIDVDFEKENNYSTFELWIHLKIWIIIGAFLEVEVSFLYFGYYGQM
jgi:hypothetical protein